MAALRQRGLAVAPFKVGPDFIDPGHHRHVAGRTSRNLDGWMLSREYNTTAFQTHTAHCDVAVVEGVMGMFDGLDGSSEAASTAQMAKWLGLPVLLVVDAHGMARSAAALVQGFARFDPDVNLVGVILNRLGSLGHLTYVTDAMKAHCRIPVVGGLVDNEVLRMPERHLGLTTVEDNALGGDQIAALVDGIEQGLDLDGLLDHHPELAIDHRKSKEIKNSVLRLGVARDQAFCFYYPDNLELLTSAGAQLVFFSPLEDEYLPENLSGLYFGGGYPEMHARQLAANQRLREAIVRSSSDGMPIYGECGGFMYLCRELEDFSGTVHAMCGCFPFRSRMHDRLRRLGYREVHLIDNTLLGPKRQVVRGHEFHYSDLVIDGVNSVASCYAGLNSMGTEAGAEGYQLKRTLGSYVHLHFGSQPECAQSFVQACREYQMEKTEGK